ncbi:MULTISPECIES: dihydrofolate reductase [Chromobacterium]|uniref:Dihydrofolate reductase n=1 Tax=Chromobacterium rhizoryzae TaxID=1778675 RepID=A0AAD0W922_9NEIS|nr:MULTISPECIES: dihydrofolate reductase [Chromobacterium]AXT47905.1 dihydrofolate reductase [Chromobacterium rhizoryzae]OQS39721.1 diacylglycerol kinase [Chromobacterium haemolyticum]PTU68456.1 dihydrofolate reductase [Chromobacterium haemolyticum]QOD81793.1 dihydrofolate reductase [Chromobacterium haemolyticum]
MTVAGRPRLTLVAAMAAKRVIGIDNRLPWHLPEDLKHFKAVTLGKPVIMGRKTWDSIGRPLPGRRNIVVTRQADWSADGAEAAHSLEQALALAGAVEEVCLIGGAELYRQAISSADCLRLTEIAGEYPGDAHFPEVSAELWREDSREAHVSADGLAYAFVDYLRR